MTPMNEEQEPHVIFQGPTDPEEIKGRMQMLEILLQEWYDLPNNGAGGVLHSITDDQNLTDGDIEFSRTFLNEDMENLEPLHKVFGNILLDVYQSLSGAQRALHYELYSCSWIGPPNYTHEFLACAVQFADKNVVLVADTSPDDAAYKAVDSTGKQYAIPRHCTDGTKTWWEGMP